MGQISLQGGFIKGSKIALGPSKPLQVTETYFYQLINIYKDLSSISNKQ